MNAGIKPHRIELDIKKCEENIKVLKKQVRSAMMLLEYYQKRKTRNKREIEKIERYVAP